MQLHAHRDRITPWLLSGIIVAAAPLTSAADGGVTPAQAVSAIEATFGVTPGERRNHTKGLCATGEFVGTADAAEYSRSALFSGKVIPVVARYSLAGGNPNAPDTARSPRGMALEFALPDGNLQHMTMLNTPVFGAAEPQTFLDLMIALKPQPATGKPDPERLKVFKETIRTATRRRNSSPATIRRRATPTAPISASIHSSSSTATTRPRWCAGASCHRTASDSCPMTRSNRRRRTSSNGR